MLPPAPTLGLKIVSPTPIAPLEVAVYPQAAISYNHVSGQVQAFVSSYADLNSYTWYHAAPYLTLNRGRRSVARTHHGVEDGSASRF